MCRCPKTSQSNLLPIRNITQGDRAVTDSACAKQRSSFGIGKNIRDRVSKLFGNYHVFGIPSIGIPAGSHKTPGRGFPFLRYSIRTHHTKKKSRPPLPCRRVECRLQLRSFLLQLPPPGDREPPGKREEVSVLQFHRSRYDKHHKHSLLSVTPPTSVSVWVYPSG